MRIAVDDTPGALAALETLQEHLTAADPLYPVIEALRLEASGDARAALNVLERVRAQEGMSEERLTELRWHRNAGRLCVRLGELARAEELLRRAVADAPADCWSWDALAVVYLKRLMGGEEGRSVRDAARECAERAQACSPSLTNPWLVRAWIAEWELGKEPHGSAPRDSP